MKRAPAKPKAPAKTLADIGFEKIDPIIFGKVEYVKLAEIKIRPGNPRYHSPENVDRIAQAVNSSRIMLPILVGANNEIISGEARYLAAKELSWKTIPVLRVSHLTEVNIDAYRIMDNRIAELSRWDDTRLATALKKISMSSLPFNIEHIGFDHAEIDIRIGSLDEVSGAADCDNAPAVPTVAVSRNGDVWLCDEHRVVCGSALNPRTYALLMAGRQAAMSIQDGPYNVSVKNHVGGLGAIKHREFAQASGEMSAAQFRKFLYDELALASAHCAPGAVIMAFMDWRGITKLVDAGEANGLEQLNLCVWNKTNASMGSLYRSKHELIAVFKKPGAKHINNVQLGRFGRYRTNVWDAAGCNTFGANRMDELRMHPTVKPVALIADAIRDVSHRGDIVLDSFGGSGTTMIACERVDRVCYSIELDPLYVDTAVIRWMKLTGRQATLESTGQTFANVAYSRASEPQFEVNPRARTRIVAAA